MVRRRSARTNDVSAGDFLDEQLGHLDLQFTDWQKSEGLGTKKLWGVLGSVYELGARIETDEGLKFDLVAKVAALPTVSDNSRWAAETKKAHELLLVLLLGISEETKAKKSQWLAAIKAASRNKIPEKSTDFVQFLESVGGVDQARKLIAKPKKQKQSFAELAASFSDFGDPDAMFFRSPEMLDRGASFPEGTALVLVHGNRVGENVIPFATIIEQKLVEMALGLLDKQLRANEAAQLKEFEADWQKESMALRKRMLKDYRHRSKSDLGQRFPMEFEEFIDERMDDYIPADEAIKIPDIAERILLGSKYSRYHKTRNKYD